MWIFAINLEQGNYSNRTDSYSNQVVHNHWERYLLGDTHENYEEKIKVKERVGHAEHLKNIGDCHGHVQPKKCSAFTCQAWA